MTRLLGGQHPVTLGCAANLMIDLRADGADEESRLSIGRDHEGYERTLGATIP